MLSRKAIQLLTHMQRSGEWYYRTQLEKEVADFDFLSFQALRDGGYLAHAVQENEIPECDEYGNIYYPEQYRISDKGVAYLEMRSRQRWIDARSWAAFLISVVALLVSVLK